MVTEMDEADVFGEKIVEFLDPLRAKINRTYLGLEARITLDRLLNHSGAKLLGPEGEVNVHPDTVKRYFELCSLVHDYIKAYWPSSDAQAVKALLDKWTTPARSRYFQ